MPTTRYPGQTVSAVKTHNTRAILLNLLQQKTAYRVRLARDTRISVTTVTKLVDELIAQGVVAEFPQTFEGRRGVGRPQNALQLVADSRFAVGVHIGGGVYRLGLANLRNQIITHATYAYQLNAPAEQVISEIAGRIRALLENAAIRRDHVVGIGVGAPGLVNYQAGLVGYARSQGWKDVPLGQWLSDQVDLPVVVENNVRAMALGEAFFGVGRDAGSLLFIYGRVGVGAGIVVNHHIHRGISLGADEIGHTFLVQSLNDPGTQETTQTLEEVVSAPALVRQAQALAHQYPDSLLAQNLSPTDDHTAVEKVYAAAHQGDPHARQLVERSARYLGFAIVNAINLLNPDLILLGGLFAQEKETYLPVVREMALRLAFDGLGNRVIIQETGYGPLAGVQGACALALTHFFYFSPEGIP